MSDTEEKANMHDTLKYLGGADGNNLVITADCFPREVGPGYIDRASLIDLTLNDSRLIADKSQVMDIVRNHLEESGYNPQVVLSDEFDDALSTAKGTIESTIERCRPRWGNKLEDTDFMPNDVREFLSTYIPVDNSHLYNIAGEHRHRLEQFIGFAHDNNRSSADTLLRGLTTMLSPALLGCAAGVTLHEGFDYTHLGMSSLGMGLFGTMIGALGAVFGSICVYSSGSYTSDLEKHTGVLQSRADYVKSQVSQLYG